MDIFGFYIGDDIIVCSNWYDEAIGTRSYKEETKIEERSIVILS